MKVIKALAAVVVLLAVVVGPPWALITFIGNPWPTEGVSLTAPLTDGAIVGLLAVVVWVLWLQLLACIATEAIAAVTDDRVQLRAPLTLGVQQQFARRLVTAVVVAAIPASVAVGGVAAMTAPGPSAAGQVVQAAEQNGHDLPAQPVVTTEKKDRPVKTITVPVKRLDTLWDIADRVLGDGDRWPEIAVLNEGREMNDGAVFTSADQIRPGWELVVPAQGRETSQIVAEIVTVDPGDTLSEIALEQLGDADRYPEIYEASTAITQPGGQHLVDPDVIDVGWRLNIPAETPARVDHQQHKVPHTAPREVRPDPVVNEAHDDNASLDLVPSERHDPPPTPTSPPVGADSDGERAGGTAVDAQDDEDGVTAPSALLATATCLSFGALGLLALNRRRQFRNRRIGRTIAATPAELTDVEQAIVEHGHAAQKDVEFLDRALRHVAASCRMQRSSLPQLGAAMMGEDDLTLLFTQPAVGEVPEGWTATDDARAWMLPREVLLEPDLGAQPAPYPALVSIGDDEGGRTWHIDLEALGVCGIGGPPEQVAGLARFWVAELAVNAWAQGCEVLLAGQFGAEMIGLNPARLRQVERGEALARAAAVAATMEEVAENLDADVLTRRRDGLVLDSTNPVVVVVDSRPGAEVVAGHQDRERSRVVVVHGEEEAPTIELRGDGTAYLPMWGISLKAFSMAAEQAAPIAEVLAATRNLADEPMPNTASDGGPLGGYARADGSLREEYTEPRHTEGGDRSSILPAADEVYLTVAATTADDLAASARSVPETTRAEVAALDPTLDQDLADWFDDSSPRPKIHLLGPVELRALNGGDPKAIASTGVTVSFIAYLAVQDRGVTGERAMAAFGWKTTGTVQNRATDARFLLGTRPDGTDWLPEAGTSDAARRGTTPTYDLVRGPGGVLNNADLFLRLRHRAERRGDTGGCEEDLAAALSLVTGAPFEGATDRRFRWLFQGQRHDHVLAAAIEDTAHLLATRAVTSGRTDLVRLACEAARKASPHSDVAWLDLAAAAEAESGRAAADELLRDHVVDRFDEDLPPRTETVLDQRDWAAG
ncbi:LysM peptidoglycan-binding domain-containing protein [Pimelobacter simplex]|uniref:LysM peptidoglycan-binding domain-containing protein n=1 Tax=Nocardioides simplex TaxID=2045 RepID=UPI00214F94EF|nr:LysM peptidoglycan-binding domain-containing protein [Pimelobacter simplex]UUW92491.1 LysM peptidoglycan-binding domain-containing protein [Pimelobacter simplex]UUW96319.1 LysM peptidoglycan-binding domain-containing protein [Pimelobacter simplex]